MENKIVLYFHFILSCITKNVLNLVIFLYVVLIFCLKNKHSKLFLFRSFLQL